MTLNDWAGFFGAQVPGSSALLGLLFVGLSLNLSTVLANKSLADRALVAMTLLLGIILTSSLALVPGQSIQTFGIEILVVSLAVAVAGVCFEHRILRGGGPQSSLWVINALLFALAILPSLIGAAILTSGSINGLYWVAAGILVSLAKAVLDSWVLLVEVNR